MVAAIERELSGAGVSTTRRRVLLAQIKFIRASEGAVALSVAGSPRIPQLGLADRAVDALRPGGAPRPEPIWAGFAGLLTGLALCALWLLVRPIR